MTEPVALAGAWSEELSIEVPWTCEENAWVLTEVESGRPVVLSPASGERPSQLVSILAPSEWAWHRVEKEPAMGAYQGSVTRKRICESLSAIPEVAAVFSSCEEGRLKLWVLVDETSFDLNLRIAQALNGVWREVGYAPHTLRIAGNPVELGKSAQPDYRRE